MKLDERIVPKELVVGIRGDLCYVTYYEKKGNKLELNSKVSWTNWSSNSDNPIVVENNLSNGFKISGVNHRWSRQANNADNLLIEHPLFGYSFELPISRFIELISDCTVTNGVIDKELIMDKKRNLLTIDDYNKAIEELDKETIRKTEKQDKIKTKPITNQVPGQVYQDQNGKKYFFICAVKIIMKDGTEEVRYLYEKYLGNSRFPFYNATYYSGGYGYAEKKNIRLSGLLVKDSDSKVYFEVPFNFVLKNKKKLYAYDKDINLFEGYTDDTWKEIEEAMNFIKQDHWDNGSNWQTNGLLINQIEKIEILKEKE